MRGWQESQYSLKGVGERQVVERTAGRLNRPNALRPRVLTSDATARRTSMSETARSGKHSPIRGAAATLSGELHGRAVSGNP